MLDGISGGRYCPALPHLTNTPPTTMPIEITDNRARIDVTDQTVSAFLLLTKDKHGFYEQFGFETEPDMAMMLRR